MGTRSTTHFYDETYGEKVHLVSMYRQFDGYPTGHGQELVDFLKSRTVINGIGSGQTAESFANGAGCLAAQLVEHLKAGQIGGVYITTKDDSQSYDYEVVVKEGGDIHLTVKGYGGIIFDGLVQDFDGQAVEKAEQEEMEEEEV
jgi:hypothetical protein